MIKKGFTLIELLIVIAIIGIVTAIALPNLMTALQKAKQKSTMGDMKNIGTSVESYITDNVAAPGAGSSLISALRPFLVPFYTKTVPFLDGWSFPLQYSCGGPGSDEEDYYTIISYGRHGQNDGWDINNSPYPVISIADFNNDICFSNGVFSYGPRN